MHEKVDERITVLALYDRPHNSKGGISSLKLHWNGRSRQMVEIGLHHVSKVGEDICHYYSATDGHLTYFLRFNTKTEEWFLEGVHDGLAS